MTKVIEIVVIGGVGSGKSHVLELIDKALRDGYGPHVQVVSRDLSLERGLGSPGAEPSVDTIFNLKEQGVASGGGRSDSVGVEQWERQLLSGAVSMEAVQGLNSGCIADPLESAIDTTTRLLRDERELLGELHAKGCESGRGLIDRLGAHLDDLLALQLKQLSEPTVIERRQVGDVTFTELTTGRQ